MSKAVMTNIRPFLVWGDIFRGDWFTEFTRISGYSRAEADKIWNVFNGHIAGEFTCDWICELAPLNHAPDDVEQQACLTREEIVQYLKGVGYGWHITDLHIYDAPRELSEFWRSCPEYSELSTNCWVCENVCGDSDETDCNTDGRIYLRRAPQSWCYVEAMEDV